MHFSKTDLKRLSSTEVIIDLLSSKKPNFKESLEKVKYRDELRELQIDLIKMQNWIVERNERLLVIFEGGEFAGKGLAIRTMMEHLNPRSARTIALPKPTSSESKQWYFQRYVNRIPDPGEIVLFDRSWYNRALVEPVNGFCTKSQYTRFMNEVNNFESMLYHDGMIIIKLYFMITKKEQATRIEAVKMNQLRRWQLTTVDKNAQKLWDKFKKYEKDMLEKTHTKDVPWTIIDGNNQFLAQILALKHILKKVSYK